MELSQFNYDLPEKSIALYPPKKRGATKLLALNKNTGKINDSRYECLGDFLRPGDVLVLNNTSVLPARLKTNTEGGAERELLLLEKHGQSSEHHSSLVMYRRKIKRGQILLVGDTELVVDEVFENGTAKVHSEVDLWDLAEQKGSVPLPPYMHRNEEPGDRERYQTVFAKEKGSVAAPTASLNLTTGILQSLRDKGVEIVELTLHVGLGTFMPIRVDDVTKHKMHQEYFEIAKDAVAAIQKAKKEGRRVVAVGTTVTRTLEFCADKIMQAPGGLCGEANIFIYPGYTFKIVDALLTNFHAPHSTVLMMAAAFAGWENLKHAYEHALENEYKFLSYGDSMLIC
jgi:S-adenosylmethionine:tRNA ribosyltransferase-isomerase